MKTDPTGKQNSRLHESEKHLVIKELRAEITKGWDGPVSKRSMKDILSDKIKQYKPLSK